ncbi:MAG: helix-turn-helix transcriptional regulator [Clostridiales bacterium]|nr:helix-turn-helix transcriptional regulator [Clostridiales bacterium]
MTPTNGQDRAASVPTHRMMNKSLSAMRSAWGSVRVSRWPYMLIFSLAPLFSNMKNSLIQNAPRILGMDGVYIMGIAYSLSIGLIFLLTRPEKMHIAARRTAIAAAVLFAGWIFTPIGLITPWLSLLFGFAYGACAGIALFGFIYALNDAERLLGAGITVLFSLMSQIIFSLPALWDISGPLYIGAQVIVTLVCLVRFKTDHYMEQLRAPKEPRFKALGMALYFFFAHRAIGFFYSYLPHATPHFLIGLAGIAVFLIAIFVFFHFHFNTWHLCNLFFAGMILAYALRLLLPKEAGIYASDILQDFSYMGYIASYYLLGFALARNADYRRFRLMIIVIFGSSLLLHMLPNLLNSQVPEHMTVIGGLMTLVLFVVFALLSPLFSKEFFIKESANQSEDARRADIMVRCGLTTREQEIVQLMLSGKECAYELDISLNTVKYHSKNIYRKLNITGRSELPNVFMEH